MGRTEALGRFGLAAATVAVAATVLAGCEDGLNGPRPVMGRPYAYAPPPPPPPISAPPPSAFDPQAFAWSVGGGSGALGGRVSYRAAAGEHWTCAGQTIALIPAVRYSGERMLALYGSDARAILPAAEVRTRNAAQPGIDYGRYVRTASCDGRDGFSFRNLPPGPYFLIARARPRARPPGPDVGVVIMQRVDIAPGPTRIVVPQP